MSILKSINPYNGEVLKDYNEFSEQEVDSALEKSKKSFDFWQKKSMSERASLFYKLADLLLEKKKNLATTITLEMGKPIKESLSEIEKCSSLCRFYADNTEGFLEEKKIDQETFVTFQPLGCILAIMPWNFPFWQVLRFACPALMGGNVALLKHASNVSGCSVTIEKLFLEAGFPDGAFQSLLVKSDKVKSLIAKPWIKALSLTGSEAAGRAVAALAGHHLKKSLLELGGSDPYLIYPDANVEKAAKLCLQSRTLNAGQSCIGAKRFIIHTDVYTTFKEIFIEEAKKLNFGDPLLKSTDIGPLAKKTFKKDLEKQILDSLKKGAHLAFEYGKKEDAFHPIMILENINKNCPIYHEETFGPLASFYKVKDMNEGIQIANDVDYGLGAGIFSQNIEKAKKTALYKIQAGSCFVNDFVKSDPQAPFGGIKNSGYGRELSNYGLFEFLNIKTLKITV